MKKLITILSVLGSFLFILTACDNELDLTADKVETPILYGFLNRADTAQYIRLERAFLNPDNDASEIAQNPDSLYYPNALVQLKHEDSGEVFTFTRVDGKDEGYPRNDGIFAASPNYLYKLKFDQGQELIEGDSYQIMVDIGGEENFVTATTRVVSDMRLSPPLRTDSVLRLRYPIDREVKWVSEPDAAIFDVNMIIYYQEEFPENPGERILKKVVWELARNIPRENDGTTDVDFGGEDFYRLLGSTLEPTNTIKRYFFDIEFEIVAGGSAISDYIEIVQANTGLTSAEIVPTFSNLSNGLGIFSSKNSLNRAGFDLDKEAMDSLLIGIHTRDLNFQ